MFRQFDTWVLCLNLNPNAADFVCIKELVDENSTFGVGWGGVGWGFRMFETGWIRIHWWGVMAWLQYMVYLEVEFHCHSPSMHHEHGFSMDI